MKYLSTSLIFIFYLGFTGNALAQNQVGDKLETLILPVLNFKDTPLSDAIEFLQRKTIELDPKKKGVNIAILNQELRSKPVTLRLWDIPIGDAVRYTSMLAGAEMNKGEFAVTIVPKKQDKENEEEIAIDASIYQKRLKTIVVPSVEFHETPLTDALDFLVAKSRELDAQGKGINIVYHGNQSRIPITLRLNDIPFDQVLQYTVEIAEHKQSVETNAVVISPK